MRTFSLFCLWLLLSAFTPGQQIVALNPQQRPDNASAGLPAIDDSLTGSGYPLAGGNCAEWGHRVPCYSHLSTVRAQTVSSYCTLTDGTLAAVNANTTRLCNGNGALIEEARTNSALWARDMTNAAWVKVGMGSALNATGADGIANSATTLTATGTAGSCTASCTILQTLTLGSTADTYSVYLMRVTGSGAVNITINNLVGTTACTLVTTSFTRCTVTATLANPVIGVQLTALNDVVIADFNQLEAGSFVTSAIPTTTVGVARAADNVTPVNAFLSFLSVSEKSAFGQTKNVLNATVNAWYILNLNSTGVFTDAPLRNGPTPNTNVAIRAGSATPVTATLGSGTMDASTVKSASSWGASGVSVVANNGTLVTAANVMVPTTSSKIGSYDGSSSFMDGYLQRLTIYNSRIPDVTLKAMTQ